MTKHTFPRNERHRNRRSKLAMGGPSIKSLKLIVNMYLFVIAVKKAAKEFDELTRKILEISTKH